MKHIAECPNCQLEFETTVAAAQDGLRCPKCDTGFVPDSLKQFEDTPKPRPPVEAWELKAPPVKPKPTNARELELTCRAEQLQNLSYVLIVVAVIALFISFATDASYGFGNGCLTGAISLYFFAQLFHIRAALEKK